MVDRIGVLSAVESYGFTFIGKLPDKFVIWPLMIQFTKSANIGPSLWGSVVTHKN